MMLVSKRLEEAMRRGVDRSVIEDAQRELYRGQCNCSFWHGAFGGTYLPHLRNAVFNHLIAAENILDKSDPVEPGGSKPSPKISILTINRK